MLSLETFKEGGVIKMATKAYSPTRVGRELKQKGHPDWPKNRESMPEVQKKRAMRILIPVEGTPESEILIPFAQQLATELNAEIYLVRVVVWIDAFSGLRFDPDILRMMDDAARYLGALASRFELPADRVRPLVSWSDNAAKEIITIAENEGIDLIIMASNSKGWLQRLTQGSMYRDVLRSQVCPVLGVPQSPTQASLRHHAMAATRP